MTEEISRLKDLIKQQSSSAVHSAKEASPSLEFLSKEYDEFLHFKTVAIKGLQRPSGQLTEVKAKVDAIGNDIDECQEHSFQHNVKIVGVPEASPGEAASITSRLRLKKWKRIYRSKI